MLAPSMAANRRVLTQAPSLFAAGVAHSVGLLKKGNRVNRSHRNRHASGAPTRTGDLLLQIAETYAASNVPAARALG
jgi:hypothetical protein